MNTYEYRCKECGDFEVSQTFLKKPKAICPVCGKKTNDRLMSAPSVINMGPRTLGTLAEKKTSTMGRYKKDKMEEEVKINREKANDRMAEEAAKLGGKPINRNKLKKPWYSEGAPSTKKINSLTDKQKIDYIKDGKLP